jgi:hypothetical protein
MAQLKIGDRIYRTHYKEITDVYTIDRLTKTQAISGNMRFKIDYHDSWVNTFEKDRWSSASYYIESEKLKIEYKRQKMIRNLKAIDFSKFSDETLESVLILLKQNQ